MFERSSCFIKGGGCLKGPLLGLNSNSFSFKEGAALNNGLPFFKKYIKNRWRLRWGLGVGKGLVGEKGVGV